MGHGDLNNKKSWHTNTMKNQERVWKAEKKALEERNKTRQLQREREEERAMEEIMRLQEAAGGTARSQRVEWMYSGEAADSVTGINQEQESYLLGKRRVDNLVLKDKAPASSLGALVSKDASNAPTGIASIATSATEMLRKAAADPLAEIERRRKQKMEEELARQLRIEKIRETDNKGHKHRRHHRSHRDAGEDRHRQKRRRYSDSRSCSRSRSPRRDEHRDAEERHDGHKHRSSRYRNESTSSRDARSRSPRRRRRDDEYRGDNGTESRQSRRSRDSDDYIHRRRHDGAQSSRKPRNIADITPKPSPPSDTEREVERAAKLAAMQSNASQLEVDRLRRLRDIEERDAKEKSEEDQMRLRGGHNFNRRLHEQASNVDLSTRLRRPGLERFDD